MDTVSSDPSQFYSFKDTSDLYIKYRPTYPERLYEKVIKFCQESETCTWELAVDVACGSGQSTLPLAKFFEEADRIVKPGGSLILYSFGTDSLTHPEADRYMQYLDIHSKYVAKYHPATEKLINRYRDVTLPYLGWRREELEPYLRELSIEDYGGYVASLGSAQWFTDSPQGHDLPGEIIRT
ncbi:uncharacterized protein LOC106013199 [Aplysia californica]|uniref:Uncharacterized protein LOC106013199 n=1 Tax=Aplysia californica TaxID=6500 RepID=A0ABM1AA32_APLCA|nr:uncharacterized protein LOC106013199 [Aplysia californica]